LGLLTSRSGPAVRLVFALYPNLSQCAMQRSAKPLHSTFSKDLKFLSPFLEFAGLKQTVIALRSALGLQPDLLSIPEKSLFA